jgi:hypothetical protein
MIEQPLSVRNGTICVKQLFLILVVAAIIYEGHANPQVQKEDLI